MRKLAGVLLMLSLFPAAAQAAEPLINSTTIVRFEERSIPGFEKQRIVPATQFVGIDTDNIGATDLSLHLYGWGRVDLADRSTSEGTTDGDLGYGYLKYRFNKGNGTIKAGRFSIFEGVANENIDGMSASLNLARGFAFSLFGGAPSHNEGNDNLGDYIFGGRFSYRYAGRLELGVSALREGGLTNGPTTSPKDYRQLVGADLWASPVSYIDINGRVSYNTATSGLAEHSWLLSLRPHKQVTVAGEYRENRLQDFFSASTLRTLFNPDISDKVRLFGGNITWLPVKMLETTLTYQRIKRDTLGNADRYGAELRMNFLENKLRPGASYFRVKGDTRSRSYHEVRGYILYDPAKLVTSLDAIAHIYDEKIYNKKNAYEIAASLGYRFLKNLLLSADMSYGENPQYKDEVKGLLRLTYNYTLARKGAGK
jgi:hypothetical protein